MFSSIKSTLALVLLSIFLMQIFSKAIIYADYYINKDYIANVLCVNKDVPEMHCDGECHLKSELQKDEKKEHSPINSVNEKSDIQLFSESKTDISILITNLLTEPIPYYYLSLSDKHTTSIFYPPVV